MTALLIGYGMVSWHALVRMLSRASALHEPIRDHVYSRAARRCDLRGSLAAMFLCEAPSERRDRICSPAGHSLIPRTWL